VSAKNGSLVGTLSSSDFKGVTEGNLPHLTNPVREYMAHEPLTCTLKTPLRDVIELLASSGVHRVYVTEGNPKSPVGVISMTDIIKVFAAQFC
jgi:CBS domain-containing protein